MWVKYSLNQITPLCFPHLPALPPYLAPCQEEGEVEEVKSSSFCQGSEFYVTLGMIEDIPGYDNTIRVRDLGFVVLIHLLIKHAFDAYCMPGTELSHKRFSNVQNQCGSI